MWTTVYMTQNLDTARKVREKIEKNSIITTLHRICSVDGNNSGCYEILVPYAELNEAHGILIDD